MKTFPKRGEVWLVNWNPARGSEQAGIRPALIVQNDIGNENAATTIIAAISTTIKPYPMNVVLDPPEGGLKKPSIVKTGQLLTITIGRLEKRLGFLTPQKILEVDNALKLSLALK